MCCIVEDKDIVDGNVNVNGFQPQPMTDYNVNQGTRFADGNINDNRGICFADVNDNVDNIDIGDEVDIYPLREKPPRVRPNRVSPLQINFNDSLQTWLDDEI